MKNTKNYISILMLFGLISQNTFTKNIDEPGKTEFIKYVEQREKALVDLKNETSKLWNNAFYTTVHVTHGYNSTTTTTRYHLRSSCTDDMLKKIYEGRKKLKNFEADTRKEIAKMVQEGAFINVSDNQGKTALNYAQSRQIYNALRYEGADFQIEPFVAMNKYQLMVAALVAAGWAALGGTYLIDEGKIRNESINRRDEMGRTPLMNYIIQEEDRIELLRERNSFISLADTKATISRMIAQGARLDIRDFDGKTVVDYCRTVEIYNYVNSLNEQSYYKWLNDYGPGIALLSIVSICVLIKLFESDDIPGINEFDRIFEKSGI